MHVFNKNMRDGILTISIFVSSFLVFWGLSMFWGFLFPFMITFTPALLALIFIGIKQHEKEELERKKKEERDKKKMQKLLGMKNTERDLSRAEEDIIKEKLELLERMTSGNSSTLDNETEW